MNRLIQGLQNWLQGRGPTRIFKVETFDDRAPLSVEDERAYRGSILYELCEREEFIRFFGGKYVVIHNADRKEQGRYQVDSFSSFERAYAYLDSLPDHASTLAPEYIQRLNEVGMGPFIVRTA